MSNQKSVEFLDFCDSAYANLIWQLHFPQFTFLSD